MKEWIKELEERGLSMKVLNMLLQIVNSSTNLPPGQKEVGKNWITRFVKRNSLHSILSHVLHYHKRCSYLESNKWAI
jgi:hypothetical protein